MSTLFILWLSRGYIYSRREVSDPYHYQNKVIHERLAVTSLMKGAFNRLNAIDFKAYRLQALHLR